MTRGTAEEMTAAIDARFAVPFLHRLRFTNDVFGDEQNVLADLLQVTSGQSTRVQFWIDRNVASCHPNLESRILSFVETQAQLTMPRPIQLLPGGEAVKNEKNFIKRMLAEMNAAGLDRRSYVIVIGGGAVLDAVGFAASVSHRGIRLIRLPTTTLSQADSGIGVKNGVNLFSKKNWMGTFAVPWAVINDAKLLTTLSDRDFRCGFSEAVKASVLKDRAAFEGIEAVAACIRERDAQAALSTIARSAKLHLDHITQGGDPFESLEARPLDFGHWSAHKLEVMSDFELRHGEAVAIGVAVDSMYSSLKHGLPAAEAERIIACLLELGLALDHECVHDTETLFAGLEEFRQHLGGRLTVTMLTAIGTNVDVHEVDREAMIEAIGIVGSLVAADVGA